MSARPALPFAPQLATRCSSSRSPRTSDPGDVTTPLVVAEARAGPRADRGARAPGRLRAPDRRAPSSRRSIPRCASRACAGRASWPRPASRSPSSPGACARSSPPSAPRSTSSGACAASPAPPGAYVAAVEGTGARIVDTRKTLPGWRALDKYATAVGGALNHRTGLYDGILLKDNHVALAGGVALAVKTARAAAPAGLRIQVEVESEADAVAAVEAGADFLLLDNCTLAAAARDRRAGRRPRAARGERRRPPRQRARDRRDRRLAHLDRPLTHSAPAADVALEIDTGGIRPGSARA